MDDIAFASAGELARRIRLPLDDPDHMPPSGKPQLAPSRIELVIAWVNDPTLAAPAWCSDKAGMKLPYLVARIVKYAAQ